MKSYKKLPKVLLFAAAEEEPVPSFSVDRPMGVVRWSVFSFPAGMSLNSFADNTKSQHKVIINNNTIHKWRAINLAH